MKFKLSLLMVLISCLSLNAADDTDAVLLTAGGIKQNFETACQQKNADEALKWYHVACVFFHVDYKQLRGQQRKNFMSMRGGMTDEIRRTWPDQEQTLIHKRHHAERVKAAKFILPKIEAGKVQIDLSELLGGRKFPADNILKAKRISELKAIGAVEQMEEEPESKRRKLN